MPTSYSLDFPRYHGAPPSRGAIRTRPEDFRVDEFLSYEPDGEGEHLWLQVEKRGNNTQWVARQLAKRAGINPTDVSYAGLKDRHALTTQWFSLWLPGKAAPDLDHLGEGIKVLRAVRHGRKLKRGGHQSNRFTLRIRDLEVTGDLEARLLAIRDRGVPNYFGEQRFGLDGGNLQQADQLLAGNLRIRDRHRRSLIISSARSYLFNSVVAARIEGGVLDRYLEGDKLMLAGSSDLLKADSEEDFQAGIDAWRYHPTAPLMGRGRALVEAESLAMEADILARFVPWCEGLERLGQVRERRSVRFRPRAFNWLTPEPGVLELSFELPPGTYATSVLRECCLYRDASQSI
ncbi:tRNA pseudouridine(13) synthase TruD [Motiliproteus sp. SC1-56]|uniref:tRNA pseudouridine(13) synthase TruD n=1 Tax=Motiliproteus sp. SC1-56 TaxID=2799565 RepID=UPI001A9019F9|nr:tRNA pseudouridine(13) synthase TruD [Motiliproteus sp. SC1-56]